MRVETVRQFTDEHPAQFEMSLTNTSGGPLVVSDFRLGPRSTHYKVEHESAEANLVVPPTDLLPTALEDPESGVDIAATPEQIDGCWRLTADLLLTLEIIIGQLDSGDSIHETFNVYTHRESEECLKPGTYRFTEEHSIQHGAIDESTDLEDDVPVTFETRLRITEDTKLQIEGVDVSIPT